MKIDFFEFKELNESDVEAIFLGLDELKRKRSQPVYAKLSRQVQQQVMFANKSNVVGLSSPCGAGINIDKKG